MLAKIRGGGDEEPAAPPDAASAAIGNFRATSALGRWPPAGAGEGAGEMGAGGKAHPPPPRDLGLRAAILLRR